MRILGPVHPTGRPAASGAGSFGVSVMLARPYLGFWLETAVSTTCTSGRALRSPDDLIQLPVGLLRALHRTLLRWPLSTPGS